MESQSVQSATPKKYAEYYARICEQQKQKNRDYYATHPEYRERKRQQALDRYYRIRAEKTNLVRV
jgi:hypothetical protein